MELETQLLISKTLGFGDSNELSAAEALAEEVGRMISAVVKRMDSVATVKLDP